MNDTSEEFDELEVIELVAEALSRNGSSTFKPKTRIPIGIGDSGLLEQLDSILSKYLNKADVQMVLHEIRGYSFKDLQVDKTLEDLHLITKNCRRCKDANPDATIPFWNVSDPDIMFVSDTPYFDKLSMEYFTNSASKAGFTSSRICMTFVNRCSKKSKSKHTIEEIESCIPFLHSEIQVLKPKLIVTMGLIATCAVLPAKMSINEGRGNILWLGPWPILPTYSPAYVLRGGGHLTDLFEQDMEKSYNFVYGEK
jgi:uracil-DNA glycosylase family 4